LVQRLVDGEVVVFAGAGISTENPDYSAGTFYEEIRYLVGAQLGISFPALMTKFCDRPDGRVELIDRIKRRFAYFEGFDYFYNRMTRFHRAVRPLYMIRDVITTNWDDFFEREAGFDPIVYDEDLPLLAGARRRVLKIHGSITNIGSIVATEQDYRRSFKRLNDGPLGAYLKHLMSTKTILYTGYSLRDENYLRLLANVAKLLGPMARQSYFLSPYADAEHIEGLPIPLEPIATDGAFFFEQLRHHINAHFPHEYEIVSEESFDAAELYLQVFGRLHIRTADKFLDHAKPHPLLPFALSYQDGVLHGLQRFKSRRHTGEYYQLAQLNAMIHAYEDRIRDYLRQRDYWNAVYFRGYQNAIVFLLAAAHGDLFELPEVDVIFDPKVDTLAKLLRFPRNKVPIRIGTQGAKIIGRVSGKDLVPDHTPYG
jgi:hypothetical protein